MSIKILMIIMVLTLACKNQQSNVTSTASKEMTSKANTSYNTDYWVTDGNLQSDTILLISGGGPKWALDILSKGKTIYRYMPQYNNYGIAYVHQSQTLDERIIYLEEVLSLDQAKQEVVKNTEMLDQAISYYKDQNKTVIVIGKSHGAYVIQDYLATRKSKADQYFLLAGRLNINPEMTEQQLRGFCGEFSEDGLTYIPEDETVDFSDESPEALRLYANKQMLKAGYGSNNYLEKLKNVDLSNVTYFYGTRDQNIGRLSDKELAFLQAKKVTIIETAEDHSGVTYAFIDKLKDGSIRF